MFTRIDLPPELEALARDRMTSGRYGDTNDVNRAACRRLQDAGTRRHGFDAMLAETRAAAERNGAHDVDAVLEEMDAIHEPDTALWHPGFKKSRKP